MLMHTVVASGFRGTRLNLADELPGDTVFTELLSDGFVSEGSGGQICTRDEGTSNPRGCMAPSHCFTMHIYTLRAGCAIKTQANATSARPKETGDEALLGRHVAAFGRV